MTGRYGTALGVAVLASGLTMSVVTPNAQEKKAPAKWVLERTPDGKPDLQGVWANNTVTPLQRPKQWEGKATLTDAEVAELQRIAQQIYDNDGDAQFGDGLILAVLEKQTRPGSYDPGTGNYNQFWLVGRDWHDRRTSLITDPPDGKLPPMTPEGKKRVEERTAFRKEHQYDDPETLPLGERCVHFSTPRIGAGYNSYLQIVQTPSHFMVMNEMAHESRVVPIDNRPRSGKDVRPWNGESRARWEGDTLVVETKNFSPKNEFMGATDQMTLVERYTRVSKDVLNYEFTVTDPQTWTKPWTAMIPLARKDEMIFEYACHEANSSMEGMLKGHRFQEKQEAAKKTSGGGNQ
ncbi:MAG: hypothetical protein FJW27_05785 [Acidimicrobiia bacterium]|nr:hypothetical protein [Acidimicrobiia bacterium]